MAAQDCRRPGFGAAAIHRESAERTRCVRGSTGAIQALASPCPPELHFPYAEGSP